MLKQRIITALLLLAVLLPALFYPAPEPFCGIALILIVGAGWEWSRLNGCSQGVAVGLGVLLGAGLAWLWLQLGFAGTPQWVWQAAALVWVMSSVFLLRRGVSGWARVYRPLRLVVGLFLIGLAWWALAQARHLGTGMLLSMLVLVWTADSAAYFGGKTWGRRKLTSTISPGKSWEGVYSGMLGVVLVAVLWIWAETSGRVVGPSLYGRLWDLGPAVGLVGLLFLTGFSVVGDLIESLVKRSAGVKDSSGLLPGHGGVLDRVDALLPVLPLAMMLVSY